jgi:hypothetical protein
MKEHESTSTLAANQENSELVRELMDCAVACETCATACLNEEDVTMMARCIELDRDCAELCMQGVHLLLRDSELAHPFLVVCEEACRMCAEECAKHEHAHCSRCAEACQRCADACRSRLKVFN